MIAGWRPAQLRTQPDIAKPPLRERYRQRKKSNQDAVDPQIG